VRRIERIANDANAGLDAIAIIVAPYIGVKRATVRWGRRIRNPRGRGKKPRHLFAQRYEVGFEIRSEILACASEPRWIE